MGIEACWNASDRFPDPDMAAELVKGCCEFLRRTLLAGSSVSEPSDGTVISVEWRLRLTREKGGLLKISLLARCGELELRRLASRRVLAILSGDVVAFWSLSELASMVGMENPPKAAGIPILGAMRPALLLLLLLPLPLALVPPLVLPKLGISVRVDIW